MSTDLYTAIRDAMADAINRQLDVEETYAWAALEAGCGYAIVKDDPVFEDGKLRVTYSYMLLASWPHVEKLVFPSFEAYELWAERNLPA